LSSSESPCARASRRVSVTSIRKQLRLRYDACPESHEASMRHSISFFVLLAVALPGRAAEPPEDGALLYRGAKRTLAGVKDLEFTRMLTHILEKGADMRPGDGWFKPSESRYGWKWFADRHGQKPDGRITVKDFKGPSEMFRRLDRDRDGVLTAADFDWSDKSPLNQQLGMAARWIPMNSDDAR